MIEITIPDSKTADAEHPQQEFRFRGMVYTGDVSYWRIPHLPRWLNPFRRYARYKANERIWLAVHSDTREYTGDRQEIFLRLKRPGLLDRGDQFNIGWHYTLLLHAPTSDEAYEHAESVLDERPEINEYSILSLDTMNTDEDTEREVSA